MICLLNQSRKILINLLLKRNFFEETNMSDSFGLDDKTRFLVLYLDAEMKPSRITKILKRPERTIYDWIDRTDQGEDIRDVKKGRGRKSTISATEKKMIMRQVREIPHKATTRRLAGRHELGKSSIHRILVEKNAKYEAFSTLKELNSDEKLNRVEFCKEMLGKRSRKIEQTFYSDEMGIKLSETTPKKTWQTPTKKVKLQKPIQNVKLNCWGAVSRMGATSLELFKENLKAPKYQSILEEHQLEMQKMYPNGFFFIHDNHKTHTACEAWMENNDLERIQFPTYSPDLNIIENVWFTLKERVSRDAPRTEAELVRSLRNNWKIITLPENLDPYFNHLYDRYNECIEKEGDRLKY